MHRFREALKLLWFRTLVGGVGVILFLVVADTVNFTLGVIVGGIVVAIGLWGIILEEEDRELD